jgi:hypothetical protein
MTPPTTRRARRRLFHAAACAISLAVVFMMLEVGLRVFKNPLEPPLDEKNLVYRYDPDLGWFPIPNLEKQFVASRRISIRNNGMGFRDHEYTAKKKPRLIFLGDSFVWGFDVEQNERFTEQLQAMLPEWEILNLGVSGYGTDQEFLLLQKVVDTLRPDVVLTIFCSENDQTDNSSNSRYGYFKPYFVAKGNELHVSGTPVPRALRSYYGTFPILFKSRSVREFAMLWDNYSESHAQSVPDPTAQLLREMKGFSQRKGAPFFVALTRTRPAVRGGL